MSTRHELSLEAVGCLRAVLEGDDTRETFTTEAQRKTEGTEEVKAFD
jgi:hypothetical protein